MVGNGFVADVCVCVFGILVFCHDEVAIKYPTLQKCLTYIACLHHDMTEAASLVQAAHHHCMLLKSVEGLCRWWWEAVVVDAFGQADYVLDSVCLSLWAAASFVHHWNGGLWLLIVCCLVDNVIMQGRKLWPADTQLLPAWIEVIPSVVMQECGDSGEECVAGVFPVRIVSVWGCQGEPSW